MANVRPPVHIYESRFLQPNQITGVHMRLLIRSAVLAAVLGIVATSGAEAQTSPHIGFKLGASFSTFSTDDAFDEDVKTLTKFTGGGFMRFDMGAFAIQPELMYVTKGGRFEETFEGVTVKAELRLDYIEIPVLLVVPLMRGPGVAPYLYGGPAFALEARCQVHASADGFSVTESCDDADEGGFDRRKFDVGAMLGGGVAIPMGPGSILLEGRYNFGLMNLNDSEQDGTVRNRSGAVLAGYSIPIGRR
jgi:hypothetical protein